MPDTPLASRDVPWTRPSNMLFFGLHIATAICVVLAGVPPLWVLALCLGSYTIRAFGVTAGYHRYFAHRTYKTSRPVQFVLAILGELSLQKGVLWWAAHHRKHHRYSDTDLDVHSPKHGFLWSHLGWIFHPSTGATDFEQIKDFAKYPELRFINRYAVWLSLFVAMCAAVYFTLGFQALVWGCFVSTILLWHATFSINSLAHVWGKRVYETSDTSRNNWFLALISLGEGWHNNHHYYPSTAQQGFRWWELDVTFYVLWLMERVGLVWDLRRVPPEVVAGQLGGRDWRVGAPDTAPVVPEPAQEEPVAA